jgi:peptidyl-prolyl cis-trans isomerase A (cyclophilin A)
MRNLICIAALMLAIAGPGALAQHKPAAKPNAALNNPAALKEKAPATFKAKFVTTKGTFVVECKRAWSPIGVDRFYNLVKNGFFDHVKFFRVVPGFVVQFGMHGDPAIGAKWRDANIQDEKVIEGNKRGYLTFAKTGLPNTRSTQFFINLGDNSGSLDPQGFSAFGHVIQGMDVVDKLYSGYGEQPDQQQIASQGNAYLDKEFPKLDSIVKATIVK